MTTVCVFSYRVYFIGLVSTPKPLQQKSFACSGTSLYFSCKLFEDKVKPCPAAELCSWESDFLVISYFISLITMLKCGDFLKMIDMFWTLDSFSPSSFPKNLRYLKHLKTFRNPSNQEQHFQHESTTVRMFPSFSQSIFIHSTESCKNEPKHQILRAMKPKQKCWKTHTQKILRGKENFRVDNSVYFKWHI